VTATVTAWRRCRPLTEVTHHTDVVVLTKRHQEDEHQEGQHEVQAKLALCPHEDQHGDP